MVYKSMRVLERKPPQQVVCMEDEHGTLVVKPIQVRRCFQVKIAKLTNGSIVGVAQLIQIVTSVSVEVTNDDRLEVLDLVPTEPFMEALCASSAAFVASGEDGKPSELFKYYPKQMCKIIYPIIVQIMTNFREPLAWLGGVSHELLKGSLPS